MGVMSQSRSSIKLYGQLHYKICEVMNNLATLTVLCFPVLHITFETFGSIHKFFKVD